MYRLNPDLALIQTVDFFTPVVDDPYAFGQIAAANALSDVYAMGGTPLTAMNIVAFPAGTVDLAVLAEILRGGADKVAEAGAVLIGGHSVRDNEPKYGLSVTGVVHPDRVLTKGGAVPGDRLVLTKPLGVGVITTAIKRGLAGAAEIETVTRVMATLNAAPVPVMQAIGVHACTDVTGFGLLGHLLEMAVAGNVSIRLRAGAVPFLDGAREYAAAGAVPGGTRANLRHVSPHTLFGDDVTDLDRLLLADAQTSGGLLIAVPADRAEALVEGCRRAGTIVAADIGEVLPPGPAGEGRLEVMG